MKFTNSDSVKEKVYGRFQILRQKNKQVSWYVDYQMDEQVTWQVDEQINLIQNKISRMLHK